MWKPFRYLNRPRWPVKMGPRILAVAIVLALGGSALRPAVAVPPADAATEPRAVYLDTSFEAEQALRRAEQLAEDGQWLEAATRLQQVVRDFGRHVILAEPGRYIAIHEAIGRRIARWPDAGLATYRRAFEPAARAALNTARTSGDLPGLLRVGQDYFATFSGAEALDLAAQYAIEQGQFVAARRWLTRLCNEHPDRSQFGDPWRVKSALCSAWLGDRSILEALAEEFTADRPGPVVSWAGSDLPIGDFVRRQLSELQTAAVRNAEGTSSIVSGIADAASPTIFCGAAHRRTRFHCSTMPEATLWKFAYGDSQRDALDADEWHIGESSDDAISRVLQTGGMLGTMPVAGGALLYAQDSRRIRAVNPNDTSQVVWSYESAPAEPEIEAWMYDESAPPLHTLLYADQLGAINDGEGSGRLYAVVNRPARLGAPGDTENLAAGSAIVCLDAASGELIWRNDLTALSTAFEEAVVDGAPILQGDFLYTIGRRRKSFGFEACYLLRLNAADGKLLDMIHVGEAATGSYGYRRVTVSHPAADSDRIFVQSNLGSIAAVSLITNRVEWIHTYESVLEPDSDQSWPDRGGRPIRSWSYSPVVCWRDAVICMPLDASDLLMLHQDDGRLIRKVASRTLEAPETILGVDGDLLYFAGSRVVCYDLAEGRIVWQRPLEMGQLLGRGALTDTGLLVPTDRGLLKYPLDGGRARVYRWPTEHAGHVLPLKDQIVISAPRLLYGLVSRDDAFDRMARRLIERQDDPWVAMNLAELSFESGQAIRGLEAVNEAVRRLGGFARMTDLDARRRMLLRLTQFAESLITRDASTPASSDREPRAIDVAVRLLQMAGHCAATAEEKVLQRLRLARAFILADDVRAAVEAYQQVLSDPGLRNVRLRRTDSIDALSVDSVLDDTSSLPGDPTIWLAVDTSTDTTKAGRFAAACIGMLIRRHGADVYADIDSKARDRLQIARGLTDPSALLEVSEVFPNSSMSTEAAALYARKMQEAGLHREASRSYRRALADRRHRDRPKYILEYIEALLADGRTADAVDWLERGARDYPDYAPSAGRPDDRFEDRRRRLLAAQPHVHPPRALLSGPLSSAYDRLFPDRVAILEPLQPELPGSGWDDVLTVSGGQLDCRHPATGRSRWPRPFAMKLSHPVLVGMDASRYYLATVTRLFALTRTSGQLAWEFGETPPDDPMLEPEMVPSWLHQCIVGELFLAASDRGRVVCLSTLDGTLRWSADLGSAPAAPIVADERHVCMAFSQGVELRVAVLDVRAGRLLRTLQPADSWPLQALLLPRADRLLLVRSTSIQCMDVTKGKALWRVTTPEHFHLSTLQADADALYVSTDARRIQAHDLDDGRILWRSQPIGTRADQGIWAQRVQGAIYAAGADRLSCIDAADGRTRWEAAAPGCLKAQAPRFSAETVVTVAPLDAARSRRAEVESDRRAATEQEADPREQGKRYRIRRYDLASGTELPMTDSGELLTEPIDSFGGMILRDHSLLLIDGNRLIGLTASRPDDAR